MKNSEISLYLWRGFCLMFATGTIIFFWKNTALTLILLAVLSGLINLKAKKPEIVYFIIVSILATGLEALAISSGAWIYSSHQLFSFPVWLPLYWGMGGIVMKDLFSIIKVVTQKS